MKRALLSLIIMAVLTAFAEAAAAATTYTMDASHSTLSFVATQTGAPVEGRFKEFHADIVFADEDLANSRFDVTVATSSADTGENDRDDTLRGAELFATEKFPTAHFTATTFRRLAAGRYEAVGKLTLRDVTREIHLPFTFSDGAAGEALLKGSVKINRLDYGIGQGEWKDTEWVANEVTVQFSLRLLPGKKSIPKNPLPSTAK